MRRPYYSTITTLSPGWQSVPPGTTQLLLLDAPGNADPFVVLNMPAPSAYVFTGLSPSTNYSAVIRPVSTPRPCRGLAELARVAERQPADKQPAHPRRY